VSFSHIVPATNCLLVALPDQDREHLLANCDTVELVFDEVLYRAGERIQYIYFPIRGFISLVTPIAGGVGLEVGLVGNEGILGITLILGVDYAPFHTLVQGAGSALRITTSAFLHELKQSLALQEELKRYLYVSITQLAQTAACTRFHVVEARLARWLLMTQDRAYSDTFHVTHVFLAYILGVRRVGITKAANALQQQKLISYQRGNVRILDRAGLEAVSCACYQIDNETYQRILG
jgi:CRP-like cAMP-binding protein